MDNIEKVYLENKEFIFNYLYSLTNNKEIAEDLMSEVFLKSILAYSSFKNKSSERTWLYSIARYTFYEYIREKNKDKDLNVLFKENFINILNLDNMENIIIEKENIELIKKYLDCFSKRERDIFIYRVKGYSYIEISSILKISEGSSRVIFFRTREKLKQMILKGGFYD